MEVKERSLNKAEVKSLVENTSEIGYAEIRIINPKKTGTVTLREYYEVDSKTGDHTLREYVDAHGKARVLKISKRMVLNLKNLADRITYEQALRHPIYSKGPNPIFRVIDLEKESKDYITKKDVGAQANDIIRKLEEKEVQMFALVMGVVVKNNSTANVLKRAIYEIADAKPESIINEWESPLRKTKEMLLFGKIHKVFEIKAGRWYFNSELMGTTFDQAIDWCSDHEEILPKIRDSISKIK